MSRKELRDLDGSSSESHHCASNPRVLWNSLDSLDALSPTPKELEMSTLEHLKEHSAKLKLLRNGLLYISKILR